jgi:hypothetical protein
MELIDDFELIPHYEKSRFWRSAHHFPDILERPTANEALRNFWSWPDHEDLLWSMSEFRERCVSDNPPPEVPDWWIVRNAILFIDWFAFMSTDWEPLLLKFLFKGRHINHLLLFGTDLLAQFKTDHGYLLVTAWIGDGHWSKKSHLFLYYILPDFSGADWATVMTRWVCPHPPNEPDGSVPVENSPLAAVEIEDGRRLALHLRGRGWYRVTLHEDPPRRFLFNAPRVERPNSHVWQARYFRVSHLRRPPDLVESGPVLRASQ